MRISSSMICWNEETTIDLALKSIANFADEVVIVDTGSLDNTIRIAEETINSLNLSGQIKQTRITTLGQARLESFLLCDGDWILMQDSNLVLSDNLKHAMLRYTSLSPNRVGAIKSLNLMGDYDHFFGNQPFMGYHPVFVKKDDAKWDMDIDRLKFLGNQVQYNYWAVNLSRVRPAWRYWYRGEQFNPRYYSKEVSIPTIIKLRAWIGSTLKSLGLSDSILSMLSRAISVVSPTTHLTNAIAEARPRRTHRNVGNIQYQWQKEDKYNSPIEYVEVTKGLTLERVKKMAPGWYLSLLRTEAKQLTPAHKLGLPAVIREERKNPRYKLIYENGKIIGRRPEL